MSKIITSPVPEFPGTITLPDHLYEEQVIAWEDGIARAQELKETKNLTKINACYLPAINLCIVERDIPGWEGDKFPMTPRIPSAQLINWIIREITRLYTGEIEIPNASGPEPTPSQTEPAHSLQS